MASVFYDEFERADGPLGSNWLTDSGTWSILSGAARATGAARCHPTTQPSGANAAQRIIVTTPTAFSKSVTLSFRRDGAGTTYLAVTLTLGSTEITVAIQSVVAGVAESFGTETIPWTYGNNITFTASISAGVLSVYADANLIMSSYIPYTQYNGIASMQVGGANTYIESYELYELSDTPFGATAEPDGVTPGDFVISLVNGGAPWTPGSPGAPSFTVSAGEITAQTVDDENSATLYYTAPMLNAIETVYDPQNDMTYPLTLATTMEGLGEGGGGAGLTAEQIHTLDSLHTYLHDYANEETGGTTLMFKLGALVLSMQSSYANSNGSSWGDVAQAILDSTNGVAPLSQYLPSIWNRLDEMTDEGDITLNTVQNNIRGANLHSIADVLDAISSLSSGTGTDLDSVLAELAAIRTASLWTLEHVRGWIEDIPSADVSGVLQELAYIRTANLWTLGHVMDAIADIPTTDYASTLTDIHGDVAAIPTDPIRSLTPVTDAVSNLDGDLVAASAAILAAIALIPTDPVHDLTEDVDAIASALSAVASAVSAAGAILAALNTPKQKAIPPVWPGAANATMGTPVSISQHMAVTTPCHGVLVSITSDDLNHGLYDWGDVAQHPRAAFISFTHDSGAQEDVQPISFPSECIVPKMCQQASGFLVRARSGLTGTVTPWTINAP